MKRAADGILKDWGDRLFPERVSGRRPKNVRGGVASPRKPKPSCGLRVRLALTVNRAPEAVVNVSGGGRNLGAIRAHLNYISRRGKLELEDENGNVCRGADDLRDIVDAWGKAGVGIPESGRNSRQAFNIILSMPPGTSRRGVHAAARVFAGAEFGNHEYVFAEHTDEPHPHVHLVVKAVDREGVRLNPRKADLQRWREHFADRLREQGILANATPRRARGNVHRGEKQSVRHLRDRQQQGEAVPEGKAAAAAGGARGAAAVEAYLTLARALKTSGSSEDLELACQVETFANGIRPSLSNHETDAVRGSEVMLEKRQGSREPGEGRE